jgi:hypothetical protein
MKSLVKQAIVKMPSIELTFQFRSKISVFAPVSFNVRISDTA